MEYCYRYWSWTVDIKTNEAEFIRDLQQWGCLVESRQDCIDIWIPERCHSLVLLKYPDLQRHPIFDRH